jgi:hypothetical protein
MALDLAMLSLTLAAIARSTWTDLRDGRMFGVSQSETSITDRSLLALRREHSELLVHKHHPFEEVRTGADWEWWLSAGGAWTCLLFQAKRLSDDGRYHGLTSKLPNGTLQVDALIKTCWERSMKLGGTVWPFYCFYNFWPGPWPHGLPSLLYPTDRTRRVTDDDLPLYGCAVVQAQHVRQIVTHHQFNRRKTIRDTYLPLSRPWSQLFDIRNLHQSGSSGLDHIMNELARWTTEVEATEASRLGFPVSPERTTISNLGPSQAPDEARPRLPTRSRRSRSTTWLKPQPITRLPEYVVDLLEQRSARPRQLKPLARRVVVLPDRN